MQLIPTPQKLDRVEKLRKHIIQFLQKNYDPEMTTAERSYGYKMIYDAISKLNDSGILKGSAIYHYPQFYLPISEDGPLIKIVPKIEKGIPLYLPRITKVMKDGIILQGSTNTTALYIPDNEAIFLAKNMLNNPIDFLEALIHEVGHWASHEHGLDHRPVGAGGISDFLLPHSWYIDEWEDYFKVERKDLLDILYYNMPFVQERMRKNRVQRIYYIGSSSRRYQDYLVIDEFLVTLRSIVSIDKRYNTIDKTISKSKQNTIFTDKGRDLIAKFCWPSTKYLIKREN